MFLFYIHCYCVSFIEHEWADVRHWVATNIPRDNSSLAGASYTIAMQGVDKALNKPKNWPFLSWNCGNNGYLWGNGVARAKTKTFKIFGLQYIFYCMCVGGGISEINLLICWLFPLNTYAKTLHLYGLYRTWQAVWLDCSFELRVGRTSCGLVGRP